MKKSSKRDRSSRERRIYTYSGKEESKEGNLPKHTYKSASYKYLKASYSSKRNYNKSSKYSSQYSEHKHKNSGSTRERKRDKKYIEKRREDDFKIPSKLSMASSEYKKYKEKCWNYKPSKTRNKDGF